MLVEYAADGRIVHIVHDPVPPHMADFFLNEGKTFLDLPPVPWPPEPQFDENGDPVMGQALDEAGEPLFELTADPVSGEPVTSPVLVQVIASNGWSSVPCDILLDYVADGAITARPHCPAVVEVEGRTIVISDVPAGAMVEVAVEGLSVQLNGDDHVELDEPGPVTVTITCQWPYLEGSHDLEIE